MTSDPSGSGTSSGQGSDDRPPPVPRWVVILGLVLLLLAVAAVLVGVLGGGEHGPSRHGAGEPAAPAATAAQNG